MHLSSKDLPSMVKVTIRKIQYTTSEKKENHSIPSNIPCVKVGKIQKTMYQTWYGVNLIGKVTEWSKVITDWSASWTGIGFTFVGVTIPIQLTNSLEIKLWEALKSNNAVKKKLKHLKGKWSNLDKALVLIHPILGANVSVTGVPKVSFLVQNTMDVEVVPTGALLEVDMYIVVEVLDDAVV